MKFVAVVVHVGPSGTTCWAAAIFAKRNHHANRNIRGETGGGPCDRPPAFFICVVMPLRKGRFGRLWREAYHYLVFHLVEKTPR